MANAETRRDEYTFLGKGCTIRTYPRVVDGGVTATGVLSRERGNLITISITLY